MPDPVRLLDIAKCARPVLFQNDSAGWPDTDRFDVAVFRVDEPTLRVDLFGDYQPYTLRAFDRMTVDEVERILI
jgi:hypothetical protein